MSDQPLQLPGQGSESGPDAELHDRLIALRPRLAVPPTPDIAAAVRLAIETAPGSDRPSISPRRPLLPFPAASWRPVTAVAAAVIILAVALLTLVPATRDAVADWLGVPGIHIVIDDDTPTPASATASVATPPLDLGLLLLGDPTTLADAQSRVTFPIAVPTSPDLGPPDEIYLRERADGDQVTFLYRPRPGIPAAAETGVGLLLVQFEAPEDAYWDTKKITRGDDIRMVRVNGREALWIGNSHQLLIYPDPANTLAETDFPQPGTPTTRQSANVLLWSDNGVTYRLESDLSLDDAIRIAESTYPEGTPTPLPPTP